LEGHARGHTLVDNNIGPSQFRYLTRRSSPERSNGWAQLLQVRAAGAAVGSRNKSEGSGPPAQEAMHAPHHGEEGLALGLVIWSCICIGKGPTAHAAADQQLPILNLCLILLPLLASVLALGRSIRLLPAEAF
jgi:hypothetical protein